MRRVKGVCMHRDRVRVGAVLALSLSSLVVAFILAGCSFVKNDASSRTTLSPLTEDKMCGIVSNRTLKDNLSLNVVRYGYENSSQSGMYSCILWSSSGAGVQHSMTIEYMPTKAKQLSEITDEYSSYSQLSFEGKGGGQGWVKRDYTTMIWIYPDGHYLEMFVFDLGGGEHVINDALKGGLVRTFQELVNDIPEYSRSAGSIHYTSTPSWGSN